MNQPQPTEREVKVNENEHKVLTALTYEWSENETRFYSFKNLVNITKLDVKQVRRACRSLTKKGLAIFARGLTDYDGKMAGSGYGARRAGASFISPCDDCGDLATYDWYSKDGQQVFSGEPNAIRKGVIADYFLSKFASILEEKRGEIEKWAENQEIKTYDSLQNGSKRLVRLEDVLKILEQ